MNIRRDFPIFANRKKSFHYLDSAATSQTPTAVLRAMENYYSLIRANVRRGEQGIAFEATRAYEDARRTVAEFIGASPEEIVFTRGATDGLNFLARTLTRKLKRGDEIMLSVYEHHSNLVPWQEAARERGLKLKFFPDARITRRTKIVSVAHISNAIGTRLPVELIIRQARAVGAVMVIDAAQSVPHLAIDVKKLGADFLVFSGHKMLGPTGVGVLYGRKALLEKMEPATYGGGMVRNVTLSDAEWTDAPWRFEAGTPPIAEAIGLAAAVKYLKKIDLRRVNKHEVALAYAAWAGLRRIAGIKTCGDTPTTGIVAFNLSGAHPHDVAEVLAREGVMVRAGHQCAIPLMRRLGIESVVRASFYLYNTMDDVRALIQAVRRAKKILL